MLQDRTITGGKEEGGEEHQRIGALRLGGSGTCHSYLPAMIGNGDDAGDMGVPIGLGEQNGLHAAALSIGEFVEFGRQPKEGQTGRTCLCEVAHEGLEAIFVEFAIRGEGRGNNRYDTL
jgi:hypothetical protein